MHAFTIQYHTWNRTTLRMVPARATVTAQNRWGALRAWWRTQRQFQSLVEVDEVRPLHTRACQVEMLTHWIYGCAHA